MQSVFDSLGGRKFLACIITLAIGVVFFAIGKIVEASFIELLKWVALVYIGGNVASDVAAIFQRTAAPTTPAPQPPAQP